MYHLFFLYVLVRAERFLQQIFVDFILLGLVVATCGWILSNQFFRIESGTLFNDHSVDIASFRSNFTSSFSRSHFQCTHTCMQGCAHMQTCTYVHTCTQARTHARMPAWTHGCTHTRTLACTHAHMYTQNAWRTNTHTHTHIHTRKHSRTYMHAHTHELKLYGRREQARSQACVHVCFFWFFDFLIFWFFVMLCVCCQWSDFSHNYLYNFNYLSLYLCLHVVGSNQAESTEQKVEWAYAFDIHLNSFFPLFVIL